MNITVVKRDGSKEGYDANKINLALERVTSDLPDSTSLVSQIASELELTLFDGITSEQIDEAVIQVTLGNIKDDPIYDKIASRLYLKVQYKKVFRGSVRTENLRQVHGAQFESKVREGVAEGLLDPRLSSLFDFTRLAKAFRPERDELLKYIGLVTMNNRYGMKSRAGVPMETPQYFWMRVCMGLTLNEADPTAWAIKLYDKMSTLEYSAAGSTLSNAGTTYASLANCYLMEMDDDMESIAGGIRDVMFLTKSTGGIGLSVSKLRSEGSPVKSNNSKSSGPIPFLSVVDSTLRAVLRSGKKQGALCAYMENWHMDFMQFLDLRNGSGDPNLRLRSSNTAAWISDEFMRRVKNAEDWYMFDPAETPDLPELYGKAFSLRYNEYVAMIETGEIKRHKKMKARELYRAMLMSLQTTSHPWITFKDAGNVRALNSNTGTIHNTNLCTEIFLPDDAANIAVCNLASLNLSMHLGADGIDFAKLAESTKIATRHLDNLIDITVSHVPQAQFSNSENRAVGIGIMGFTDVLEKLGISYESEASYALIDLIMEHISYASIEASIELAIERGSYPNFEGSGWSQGLVPVDTLARLDADRGEIVSVSRKTTLDWDRLRRQARGGMRNATLMAIAPTASIGLVAGTTPGIDPNFSNIFSRTTSSGKFLSLNENLVRDLKKLGIWDEVSTDLLRNQGSIQGIDLIPDDLKTIYKTSFELKPQAFTEVAARAQKWVDQGISRNYYISDRSIEHAEEVYISAWESGLKSTYYQHVAPRHTSEQSTVRVNKTEELAKAAAKSDTPAPVRKGFGFGGAK